MTKRTAFLGLLGLAGAGAALLVAQWPRPAPASVPTPAAPASPAAAQLAAYPAAELKAALHPDDPTLALEAGALAGETGQYRTALVWFQRAASRDPKLLPAITGQGQMWMELGRPGLAAECYEKALVLAPNEPRLQLELARAYAYLRDFERALRYAHSSREASPYEPEVYRALAMIYADTLQTDESLKNATRACELGPSDAENWATKGNVLLRSGRYEEALQPLRTALARNPGHVAANVACARALIEGRKSAAADREAFALLARARLTEPRNAEALRYQGEILVRAGQMGLGTGLLREAREIAPRDPQILLALGQALVRSGQGEEGVRLVNASQQLGPRGVAFLDLEELARKNPDPAIAVRLGELYRRQELFDSALRVLERARRRSPGNAQLERALAEARRESDRAGRADP